ncbi:MAG TPA: hypothetical protein VHM48_05695 [Candidatus Limnocylindrales bacterium]|nr:hypothetical protein [Candidatus Limnocylindrales bacterium]
MLSAGGAFDGSSSWRIAGHLRTLAIGVTLVLAIGCTATPAISPTPNVGSASPAAGTQNPTPTSIAPTPSATDPVASWTRVPTTEALRGATMTRVVAGPAGLLALGSRDAGGFVSWWSGDGVGWTRSAYVGTAAAGGALALPDGFVILGRIGDGPDRERAMTWRSSDGVQWVASPIDGLKTDPIAVGMVGGRIATFALRAPSGGEPTLAWSSSDLVTWASDVLGDGGYSDAAGITVLSDETGLAFGRWSAEPMDIAPFPPGQAAFWRSNDGRAWHRTADDPDLAAAVFVDVAQRSGSDVVAVGQRWDPAGQPDQAYAMALWSSSDGDAWDRVEVPPALDPTAVPRRVVTTPTGYLLLASSPAAAPNALVASSTDGRIWTAFDPPIAFEGGQANDLAVVAGHLVAVGQTLPDGGTAADAAVWIGPTNAERTN